MKLVEWGQQVMEMVDQLYVGEAMEFLEGGEEAIEMFDDGEEMFDTLEDGGDAFRGNFDDAGGGSDGDAAVGAAVGITAGAVAAGIAADKLRKRQGSSKKPGVCVCVSCVPRTCGFPVCTVPWYACMYVCLYLPMSCTKMKEHIPWTHTHTHTT